MKIGIVSLQFEETATGGGGVHVKNICDQFLKMGHDVTVVSIHTEKTVRPGLDMKGEGPLWSEEDRGMLRVVRFLIDEGIGQPYVGEKDEELDRIKRFSDAVIHWIKARQEEFDVVNLQGHHIIPGYMAKELAGIRPKVLSYLHALETTYVTANGDFIGAFKGTSEVLKKIRQWEGMCRYADYIIGNSPLVNEECITIIAGFDKDADRYARKIKLIVSGCDGDFLMSDNEIEQKLKNVPKKIKMVTFCRIDPSKGIEYSIAGAKTAARLSSRDFCLTIAGIPSSDEYINALKAELDDIPPNLEIRFELFGAISPLEEKKKVLDDKHMYILPTLKEPFGMSLIEASARGNMVISADTNGPKYIFENNSGKDHGWGIVTRRGILAKMTGDYQANFGNNVGKAITWTTDNWSEGVRHVLEFNKKIKSTWTWESIARQYIELFRS